MTTGTKNIEAIFLDVGNTLRIVIKDEGFMTNAKRQIVKMTGAQMSPDEFFDFLENRYQVLRKRAKNELIEASEKEMWTQWMLPDFPQEKISAFLEQADPPVARLRWAPGASLRCLQGCARTLRPGLPAGHHRQHHHRDRDPRLAGGGPPDGLFQDGRAFVQGGHPQTEPGDLLGSRASDWCRTGKVRVRG